ncbi:MAG TPA: alpha/beta hydrolase domain-containing protein [Myxococcales bacterium]|jgi:hypothetical protein
MPNRALLLCLCAAGFAASAKVTAVDVVSREDLFGGKRYGDAGAYEKLVARVHYALDPNNPHNRAIVDLDRAERTAQGLVEFEGDVVVVRPKDRARANGSVLLDLPNRGGSLSLRNGLKSEADVDEWILRQGYILASVGWQFDIRPASNLLGLKAPVARGLTGRVRADFVVPERAQEHTVSHLIQDTIGGTGYPAASFDDAVLTERSGVLADRGVVPKNRWRFTDPFTIHSDDGFVPGRIYEVIYTAKDPAIAGAGLAAVRDFADDCKHDPAAIAPAARVHGFGISQTGRFLRHFLYQGFNASESGAKVFDGLLVYVAGAGRGSFNHRFAQPSRDTQSLSPLFYPNDLFPFADVPTKDPWTGKSEGLLDRARSENVVPKIFYINTAYEYWSRGASLLTTTPDGKSEVPLADESRLYFIAGVSHVPGPFPPGHRGVRDNLGQNLENTNSYAVFRRAFLQDLDAWVRGEEEAPKSRYPRLSDGTLVNVSALRVKSISGVPFPRDAYEPYAMDLGGDFAKGLVREPPRILGTYPTLVPQVGKDGNDLAGVHRPEIDAPLATYTGWNVRDAKTGFAGIRSSFIGSYLPWPKEEVLSRYRSANEYAGAYATAAAALVKERFFVPDDVPPLLEQAVKEWQFATSR